MRARVGGEDRRAEPVRVDRALARILHTFEGKQDTPRRWRATPLERGPNQYALPKISLLRGVPDVSAIARRATAEGRGVWDSLRPGSNVVESPAGPFPAACCVRSGDKRSPSRAAVAWPGCPGARSGVGQAKGGVFTRFVGTPYSAARSASRMTRRSRMVRMRESVFGSSGFMVVAAQAAPRAWSVAHACRRRPKAEPRVYPFLGCYAPHRRQQHQWLAATCDESSRP